MFQVETFNNSYEFYKNLPASEQALHIFPTSSLKSFVESHHSHLKAYVISYRVLTRKLFKEWEDPRTDVYFISRIREILAEMEETEATRRLDHNLQEAANSFRFIAELFGLPLTDREQLSEDERLFQKISNELLKDDKVSRYKEQLFAINESTLAEAVGVPAIKKVYVYQEDFVFASRVVLFHLLERAGIQVIFRIPYDKRFTQINKGWKQVYEELTRTSMNTWKQLSLPQTAKGSRFAYYLDHQSEKATEDAASVKVFYYNHPVTFSHHLKEKEIRPGEYEIASLENEFLNHYLALTSKDKFFSSPYGKFIRYLPNCKKKENDIEISYDVFRELLLSGWVHTSSTSGQRAADLLIDLEDYMSGVTHLSEIFQRLEGLVGLREVSSTFDDLSSEQTGSDRVKRYMSNPFRSFSYVHADRYSVTPKILLDLGRDLQQKLNDLLLEEDERVSIEAYRNRLLAIFNRVRRRWDNETVNMIEKRLRFSVQENWQLNQADMLQLLFIELSRDEKLDFRYSVQDYSDVIGAAMNANDFHVSGLSLENFPGKKPTLPDYLDYSWLKESIQLHFHNQAKTVLLHALVTDYHSRQQVSVFMLYNLYHVLAYHQKGCELSWIGSQEEQGGSSIYLNIISHLYTDGIIDKAEPIEKGIDDYDWEEEEEDPWNKELQTLKLVPDLYWTDLDFCARKFAFNLVEHQPVYDNELHQQLTFGMVGSLLSEQHQGSREFAETIFPLFPHWTGTQKNNFIDTESISGVREYKTYENINYPKALVKVQRLRGRSTRSYYHNRYNDDNLNAAKGIKELENAFGPLEIDASPGTHCRMCPHLTICKEGEYAIDELNS
ncbi:hypothetical protein [Halobacillus halophilus]|uniref:hypothetical protein n=1 Tax=Halobacillus halophilus TaxID=1570 RepID=UPI001CD3F542|nr:hypothetical protein [Halobacillus halophilus]MCA1011750.1 hypothetical protein [Halobacillus halophilus]